MLLLCVLICAAPVFSPVSFLETQGFDDYFQQCVKEAGGSVRRSVVELKRLNTTMMDNLDDCYHSAESFSQSNLEKLPFAADILARSRRFVNDIRVLTDSFCQRGAHYAKQSLSFVSEVSPLCRQACPGLFPSSYIAPNPLDQLDEVTLIQLPSQPDDTSSAPFPDADDSNDSNDPNENPENSSQQSIPGGSDQPPQQSQQQSQQSQQQQQQQRTHSHHHHHTHALTPDTLQPEDPITAQIQAAEDIWNGGSDFRSATSLYKDAIQDMWADFKRSMETYLQQSRFSPMSGDAFRKGGLDGVKSASEWSERNSEIIRGMAEALDDAVSDQLMLTEKLGHLAFSTLEVCRACNIPIQTGPHQMRPIDIARLRAKALTTVSRPKE
eukprot:c9700_g1_i4.p1 GENE.c9700_g1_i4~~c9700_g1_i4.p1  ORF type:complete len:382 (+),score=84.72 c9700_g1_i4:77-1222(+)